MRLIFLLSFLFSCVYVSRAQDSKELIRLNQVGYYPNAPKIAIYAGKEPRQEFVIISNTGDSVFRGSLSAQRKSVYSGTHTQIADFSGFSARGLYRVYVAGIGESHEFSIGSRIHQEVARASIKAFYYHRVSEPLLPQYAGKWSRPAGHPDDKVLIHPSASSHLRPAGTVISSPKGWYDAGDYNKYIVNSGITMGTLLAAYEDFPIYFDTLKLNIPESGDRVPDLLNEVKYNLDWMLTMQDPADGGVYHKLTNASFDGMVMPGVTKWERYVVQKGTAATLDFAAVMAQSSRVFKKFNRHFPGYAEKCRKAAVAAWEWALLHPAMIYDQEAINKNSEPKITTGGYGDRNFRDEWFWAASELYITTGDPKYTSHIRSSINDSMNIPGWNNVRMMGIYSLIRQKDKSSFEVISEIRSAEKKLLEYADKMIERAASNAFSTIMGQTVRDFIWGSNSVAANQGMLLLNAFYLSNNPNYIHHALSNLDYLLGRNATGYCFLTGFGSRSTMNPHHRPSVADGIVEPIQGFLAGGPNPGRQDRCKYEHTEPETAYVDHDCSYASNEVAINWNAPLVYLAAGIEALSKKAKY